jgi:hypothetical protein
MAAGSVQTACDATGKAAMTRSLTPFETPSTHLLPATLVEVQLPPEDAGRVMAAVTAIDPLAMSPRYDRNAWQSAPGIESYRPREGAVAGAEDDRGCAGSVGHCRGGVSGAQLSGACDPAVAMSDMPVEGSG